MITNQTLASATSAVYQTYAARYAAAGFSATQRAERGGYAGSPDSVQQNAEALQAKKTRIASASGFGDLLTNYFALPTFAFVQAFADQGSITADEQSQKQSRGYDAYEQAKEQPSEQFGLDVFSSEFEADTQGSPPLLFAKSSKTDDYEANVRDFFKPSALNADAIDPQAPPYFLLSRAAFERSQLFRNQAFSFPPTVNLIG